MQKKVKMYKVLAPFNHIPHSLTFPEKPVGLNSSGWRFCGSRIGPWSQLAQIQIFSFSMPKSYLMGSKQQRGPCTSWNCARYLLYSPSDPHSTFLYPGLCSNSNLYQLLGFPCVSDFWLGLAIKRNQQEISRGMEKHVMKILSPVLCPLVIHCGLTVSIYKIPQLLLSSPPQRTIFPGSSNCFFPYPFRYGDVQSSPL